MVRRGPHYHHYSTGHLPLGACPMPRVFWEALVSSQPHSWPVNLRASLNRPPPEPKMKITLKGANGFMVLSLLIPCFLLGLQAGCTTHAPTAFQLQILQGTWEGYQVGKGPAVEFTMTI